MTMPASLPITTDYFPDKRSLQIDYVISDYSLLPEDIISDQWMRSGKKPLTNLEVYREMVAQRLAQGFQIVVQPKPSQHLLSTTNTSSSPYQNPSSIMMFRPKTGPTEDIILSIGRIYHKLTLTGPSLTVTRYWPKHPYLQKCYHYTYRFQVPDSENYDVSWTDFKSEKLENYNWNYVDHYLCSRGEEDFGLMETLKYWRARFFLLPSNNPATKKVIEGAPRCDIYEDYSQTEQDSLVEGFIRFLETLNRIRRPVQNRLHKREPNRRPSQTPSTGSMMADKEREDGRMADPTAKMKIKVKAMEVEASPTGSLVSMPMLGSLGGDSHHLRKGHLSGESSRMLSHTPGGSTLIPMAAGKMAESTMEQVSSIRLTLNSTSSEILEALTDTSEGVSFVKPQSGDPTLPNQCFTSHEAVLWLQRYMEVICSHTQAVNILQRLVEEGLICHASGNRKHRFVWGFYLYYVVDKEKEKEKRDWSPMFSAGYHYNVDFQQDWCEVLVHTEDGSTERAVSHVPPPPPFLADRWPSKLLYDGVSLGDWDTRSGPLHFSGSGVQKVVNMDVDSNKKSDREEWGMVLYHANYTPTTAFELTTQWLVATGCILGDQVSAWARKAGSCGFHFIPVPGDPFALPFTPNSDPLRGPIFVPLCVDSLLPSDSRELFEEFPKHTREERMLMFQDSILRRFGFMPDQCPMSRMTTLSLAEDTQPKYIHCSGGMFAMIPDTKTSSPRNSDGTHCKVSATVGSYNEYIALQCYRKEATWASAAAAAEETSYYQVGFLWSWNYMLTKRWRSSHTGDEAFQDKMLADFRAFCCNEENRLLEYWQECQSSAAEGQTDSLLQLQPEVMEMDDNLLLALEREHRSEPKDIPLP